MKDNNYKNKGLGFFQILGFLLALVLGGLVSYLYINISYTELFQEENIYTEYDKAVGEMDLAVRENEELIAQYKQLSGEVEQLKSTYDANEIIRSSINNYELILGEKDMVGTGLILSIDISLAQYWIIDILSELYELGAEAIAVNDILITPKSSIQYDNTLNELMINDFRIQAPYIFKIIGNPNILLKGLTSDAGLMENIRRNFPNRFEQVNIEISDEIIILAKDG